MSSNIFSRFNAAAENGGRSFYKELRSRDGGYNEPGADNFDVEDRAGLALDEENLNEHFHDYDVEHAGDLGIDASSATLDSPAPGAIPEDPLSSAAAAAASVPARGSKGRAEKGASTGRPRRNHNLQWGTSGEDDGDNDDVPGSLLVEPHRIGTEPLPPMLRATPLRSNPSNHRSQGVRSEIPGSSTKKSRAQWEARQKQQRSHANDSGAADSRRGGYVRPPAPSSGRAAYTDGTQPGHALLSYFFTSGGNRKSTAYDRAMWRWVNVSNLDNFIRDVYDYYRDSGIRCILLARFLHLV